ncbi:MAG: hypothetical protein EOP85_04335 [Verrucomicrobiaceae bacterium]|nr:MAG: hypothetical protein EOP85_04335 [Verrucomicrobiaceae bacterium]
MKIQPPPNAQAQPPSDAALRLYEKWRLLKIAGILSIVVVLAGIAAPKVFRSRRVTDYTAAVSNARQIGLALFEFDTEYGKFPDESTIEAIRRTTGTEMKLGNTSSNDFFRQLIASGIAFSEQMFHAKIPGARKPDGVTTGNKALEKGEVGFSYLAGLSSKGNPGRPVLVTPLIQGTDRFDRTVFDGKAVILRMDNSAASIIIDKDGHALLDGRNVLDPSHPVWGGNPPRLVWPE